MKNTINSRKRMKRNCSKKYKSKNYKYTKKYNRKSYTFKKYKSKKYCGGEPVRPVPIQFKKNKDFRKKFIEKRDNFRNMFINKFNKLLDALNSKTINPNDKQIEIDDAIEGFNNGFKSNEAAINILIPVSNDYLPIDKSDYSETQLLAFVPCLVIIFENINDNNIRKKLIDFFIEHKGNINLKSFTKNISALSDAIKLQDKELIAFLLEKSADRGILSEEQQMSLDQLLTPEIVETIQNEEQIKEPIVKLNISDILPNMSDYVSTSEPEFWKPLFGEGNMFAIRDKIQYMMINDIQQIQIVNNERTGMWSVCEINQSIIPTYYVPEKNDPYMSFGTLYFDRSDDFARFNILLCASLLIFGLISKKMNGQDYRLIFKGGKAIQLELTQRKENPDELKDDPDKLTYKSEDIDILISPNNGVSYDENKVKSLSGNIAYLIKWFLNNIELNFDISILEPPPKEDQGKSRNNPYIYKLSYIKSTKRYDYRKRQEIPDFKPFSDIDFKEPPEDLKQFFDKTATYTFKIKELDDNEISFTCPNIGSLLDEKIYYYTKYTNYLNKIKNRIQITEHGYEYLDESECIRLLDKFSRAILALNRFLQKNRFPDLSDDKLLDKEKKSIINRLKKLDITDDILISSVVNRLYP